MTFVDSNIPMYLIGSPHPCHDEARRALELLALAGERLGTSVEGLQEVLHPYWAIRCRDAIHPAFSTLIDLVDEVFPIVLEDALRAREIMFSRPSISSRDAMHIAVMNRCGVSRILSFDRGFDQMPGIQRLPE